MAKITIEELYRGEKYDIMSAVTAKALKRGIDERCEEGRTWIEMELVRQTVIAIEQMKKNGCPADEDLMVWFGKLVAAEIIEDAIGKGRRKNDEND